MLGSSATFSMSPDGNRLLCGVPVELSDMSEFDGAVPVTYLLDLTKMKSIRLSPKGVIASSPVWLPDGKSFLFHGDGRIKEGIYRMNIESKQISMIVPGADTASLSTK